MEFGRLILKFIWGWKRFEIVTTMWKNTVTKFIRHIKPDIKTYKIIVINNNVALVHGNR